MGQSDAIGQSPLYSGEQLHLAQMFKTWCGSLPDSIFRVGPMGGSPRRYYRLSDPAYSCIGTVGDQPRENEAFLYLTGHFHSFGLPVPEIYLTDREHLCYLQQDLGDVSLFDWLMQQPHHVQVSTLKESLQYLVRFQTGTLTNLDFNKCYPGVDFNRETSRWDLDYMKYMFLRVLDIEVDELALDEAFNVLLDALFQDGYAGFMYRDFQSRNIIVQHNRLWFVDYQGGRPGPPAYDAASLLYQTRLALSAELRQQLTRSYADMLAQEIPVSREEIAQQVHLFAIHRLLQTLGAYGYRGIIQRKEAFIRPVRQAVTNTMEVIRTSSLDKKLTVITDLLEEALARFPEPFQSTGHLKVAVNSFSYMHGMPSDASGHGGGFVFDCRALPNPHHQPDIRVYNGKDEPIIQWFQQRPEVEQFLDRCMTMIADSVTTYINRGFTSLQVNFGCTGGKHRSVYCTEQIAQRLNNRFSGIVVQVSHLQLDR